jgi:hypothetical protein
VPELGRWAVSDASGGFDLRHLPAGSWDVVTDCFAHDPDTMLVTVEDGGTQFETIALFAQPCGGLAGVVSDAAGPLADVRMQILDAPVATVPSAADGGFAFADLPVGSYTLAAGLFGWLAQSRVVTIVADETTGADFLLQVGVSDEFEFDQGWVVGAPDDDAYEGIWQRGDPNPTYAGDDEVQPSDDHTPDGALCFVTHNQPTGALRFFGDVDGGRTTLLSPPFDATAAVAPALTYWRWQHSAAGYPTDLELRCDVSNDGGETWVNVETASGGSGGWEQTVIPLTQPGITPTEQMCIRFVAEDDAQAAGILEAAVDDVVVTGFASGVGPHAPLARLQLSMPRPNPLGAGAIVQYELPYAQEIEIGIYDTAGRLVRRLARGQQAAGLHRLSWDARGGGGRRIAAGVYFLRLSTEHQKLSRKFVIAR